MLSGKGNAEERWKTTIGIISKKKQLCTCSSLILYISLPSFCTRQRETSRNLLNGCTFYGGIVVRVLVHFFLLPLIFILHWWPLAFLILPHRRYKISMLFFQQKKCLLRFFSLASDLCRPFSRWASLACSLTFSFSLSFSCSIFQICGHAGQWI